MPTRQLLIEIHTGAFMLLYSAIFTLASVWDEVFKVDEMDWAHTYVLSFGVSTMGALSMLLIFTSTTESFQSWIRRTLGGAMFGGIVGPLIIHWSAWHRIPPIVFSVAFFCGAFAKTILRILGEGKIIESILSAIFKRQISKDDEKES